jgi:hypothetical protein
MSGMDPQGGFRPDGTANSRLVPVDKDIKLYRCINYLNEKWQSCRDFMASETCTAKGHIAERLCDAQIMIIVPMEYANIDMIII